MNIKLAGGIILVLLILVGVGYYFYETSPPKTGSFSSKMIDPRPFATPENATKMIEQAQQNIIETEAKLNEAKQRDLSNLGFLDRQFIKKTIKMLEQELDVSKAKLEQARQAVEVGPSSAAAVPTYEARGIASYVLFCANRIIAGRTRADWTREEAIESNYSQ